MNAGIVILQDGTPCLVYDEALPYPVKSVEFSRADFQVTLIYDTPLEKTAKTDPFKASKEPYVMRTSKIAQMIKTPKKEGRKLEYPLDDRFVMVLEELQKVAIGIVQNGKMGEVKVVPVVFTNT